MGIWLFAVLGGVTLLGSLGLMLGNLGRKKNLVLAGAIGAQTKRTKGKNYQGRKKENAFHSKNMGLMSNPKK